MATVSVIIPLYNKEKYITRSLNSVFAQTYQDFEIVVVDDGSTDGGPELVREYQDPRLRMICQPNEGPGFARNRGIQETTAPYLAFLDADDEWLPDFLSRYLDALTANPDCDYVVGPHFQGESREDKSDLWRKSGVEEGAWRLPVNVSHAELHVYLTMLHCMGAIVCKRHVVEKYGGFYAKAKCTNGEDRYLELQLLLNHRLCRIIEPLAWYHTETLGVGVSSIGIKPKPSWPILADPDPIRKNCPPPFREVLESYLASHALSHALDYANINDFSMASGLLRRFPLMKKSRRRYIMLLIRINLAKVCALMGRLRIQADSRK